MKYKKDKSMRMVRSYEKNKYCETVQKGEK